MCALARARAPSAPRAHAPRARTSGTSCDSPWLQSLKIWSLRQTPSGSIPQFTQPTCNQGSMTMDKDRIKGVAQRIKGQIEKSVGKMVGNKRLETDGKIDEA